MHSAPGVDEYLNRLVRRYETEAFVAADPISIPRGFDDPADQEVIALFAALLAWGRRDTMLRKLTDLCERMNFRPSHFVRSFRMETHAAALAGFGHRTFKSEDAIRLTLALRSLLDQYGGLEPLFRAGLDRSPGATDVGPAIQHFSESVMAAVADTPIRLQKHLARPAAGSACKRLCMYLRWLARPGPVDLGVWRSIPANLLVLPLDVHSGRNARKLGLLQRPSNDWKAALELTRACRSLSPADPCRYDFALFGAGAFGEPLDPRFVVS